MLNKYGLQKIKYYSLTALTAAVMLCAMDTTSASVADVEFSEQTTQTVFNLSVGDDYVETSSDGLLTDLLTVQDELSEDKKIKIEKIESEGSVVVNVDESKGASILIYHTHTTEAYRQTENSKYKESSSWRTRDNDKNIVEVGDVLAETLKNKYGFNVIHDTTDHEPPKLSTAYSRSVVTMEKYADQGVQVFIDVHRDAYGDVEAGMKDYVTVDGKRCARIMFVVGTGEGKTGAGFDEMPDWESNYALANSICEELNSYNDNFTRPIRVKTGRYNQHVSNKCLLVEIGHNANSLEEALNSAEYLAKAINAVLAKSS